MLELKNFKVISCALTLFTLIACTKTEKKISGTVEITPELQKSLKPTAVLYIIARREGETAGPPVAVKRFTQPLTFPLDFEMSQQDAMIPNTPFEGKLKITARIAQTGSATPVNPGDVEGEPQSNPVVIGENKVKISLNRAH